VVDVRRAVAKRADKEMVKALAVKVLAVKRAVVKPVVVKPVVVNAVTGLVVMGLVVTGPAPVVTDRVEPMAAGQGAHLAAEMAAWWLA
jgi:hypothetical protein